MPNGDDDHDHDAYHRLAQFAASPPNLPRGVTSMNVSGRSCSLAATYWVTLQMDVAPWMDVSLVG